MTPEQHVPLVEARRCFGPIATAIHHGSRPPVTVTDYGTPLVRIVPLSDGHMPPAHLWDAARDAIDGLDTAALPADVRRIVIDLDNLIRVYDGQDPA